MGPSPTTGPSPTMGRNGSPMSTLVNSTLPSRSSSPLLANHVSTSSILRLILNELPSYIETLPGSFPHLTNLHSLGPGKDTTVGGGWQHQNDYPLPEDLVNFFSVVDGFEFKWFADPVGNGTGGPEEKKSATGALQSQQPGKKSSSTSNQPDEATSPARSISPPTTPNTPTVLAGSTRVNRLSELTQVPLDSRNLVKQYVSRVQGLEYYDDDDSDDDENFNNSGDDERQFEDDEQFSPLNPSQFSPNTARAFALDSSTPSYGTVCLVFPSSAKPSSLRPPNPPSVWLKSKSSEWSYLAPTFTAYIRLLTVHLCIGGWTGAYTSHGLDPMARRLMARFAPERLVVDIAFSMPYNY